MGDVPETWQLCCSGTDANAMKFLVMVAFSFIVLCFTIFELSTKPESPDRAIYFSILSSVVSIWMSPPQLKRPPQIEQPNSPSSKRSE